MVSSSCSTTSKVLPKSRNPFNVSMSRSLSRWCSPMDGSSRMYNTPTKPEPICVARRIRCASPPDKVPALRFIVKVIKAYIIEETQDEHWFPSKFEPQSLVPALLTVDVPKKSSAFMVNWVTSFDVLIPYGYSQYFRFKTSTMACSTRLNGHKFFQTLRA